MKKMLLVILLLGCLVGCKKNKPIEPVEEETFTTYEYYGATGKQRLPLTDFVENENKITELKSEDGVHLSITYSNKKSTQSKELYSSYRYGSYGIECDIFINRAKNILFEVSVYFDEFEKEHRGEKITFVVYE